VHHVCIEETNAVIRLPIGADIIVENSKYGGMRIDQGVVIDRPKAWTF
jgi:hypothetical protein